MSVLEKLKTASNLEEFAALLGYQPKGLSFILYKTPIEQKYTVFSIKKKSGGEREIKAPSPALKKLQSHLANLLYACWDEIEKEHPRKSLSHGFRRKHSIITNARPHRRHRYVLNLDLENFFPAFNFGRVRGFFLKDMNFALHEPVATLIAQIACDGQALPQGSPCSPVISNLIGQLLDMRLVRFAKKHKLTYSRYADDITFSTNQKDFPGAAAAPDPEVAGVWTLGKELVSKIEDAGFTLNDTKTRMHCRGSRQMVTGLVVNEKVNVSADYFRKAKAMCRSVFNDGKYHKDMLPLAEGEDEAKPDYTTNMNPLEGILSHIYWVKQSDDRRDPKEQRDKPSAARTLFRKFLFYKYFVRPERTLLVGEGKTDNIYLREAIRRLPQFHPRLGAMDDGIFRLAVALFRYSNRAHDLLDVGGGASELKSIVLDYKRILKKVHHRPMAHPVIIVLDNDSGLKQIAPTIKKNFGVEITLQSSAPFYHVADNLYVVKTPESPTGDTCIEDFFPAQWLNVELDGKKFNPNKEHGAQGEYGKNEFAEKVVRPNSAQIDFTGFVPLLERIVAAQDHYTALKAA